MFVGFVYAFVGTGVAQVLFKHQADGSITANGSTLIGQNWSRRSARSSAGQLCVPRPSRRHRSLRREPKETSRAATTPSWPTGSAASPAATNLGPRSKVLLTNTKALVAYWHARG